ncbi:MAG TPA: stage II sporulation protein P [Clostridia bacterium]|nr:stage II sporulation protein P [Clostridia bacterium]
MKQRIEKGRVTAFFALAVPILIIVMTTVFVSPNNAIKKLALVSCAIAMPESSLREVSEWLTQGDASPSVFYGANLKGAASPINQSENAMKAEKPVDLKKVPDDIAALMAKHANDSKNDVKNGSINEYTYGKSSATSIYKNILVKNTTATKSINIEKVLKSDINLQISDKSKPAVLIFHTHTTEGFEILDRGWYAQNYNGRTQDETKNVVRVGEEIAQQLIKAGYVVIHDKTIHDLKYSGAYARSRETVQKYLDKYPNLQVVLDVHRDAIHQGNGVKVKPVTVINEKKAAQVMIISGAQERSIKNFPNWEENLSFAVKLQKTAEDMYSGLMRPLLFCTRRYNMDMTNCSLLLEMGSDVNTLDEAAYSGRLIGNVLVKVLESYSK